MRRRTYLAKGLKVLTPVQKSCILKGADVTIFTLLTVPREWCTLHCKTVYPVFNFGRSKNKAWLLPDYYHETFLVTKPYIKGAEYWSRGSGSLVAIVAMSGRDNRRHCCCCCCCLLLWKRSPNNIVLLLLLKMQPGMNFNVNSNLDFRCCLTGIQILSLRFCKYRFVYDLNRYFWETFTLFRNCRHETNFWT